MIVHLLHIIPLMYTYVYVYVYGSSRGMGEGMAARGVGSEKDER